MPLTSNALTPSLSKQSTKAAMGLVSLVWVAALLAAIKSGPSLVAHAAPVKTPALVNVINAMSFKVTETAELPLQLQIEKVVQGAQQLAYLPEDGPALDFYYLNYRPSYRAGESKIDFWMLGSKNGNHPPPESAALDLYDEFGRVKLMNIVPAGTPIPKDVVAKGEPFLWKSWAIPKTIHADFDFSERFRVVLTTSDDLAAGKAKLESAVTTAAAAAAAAPKKVNNNEKKAITDKKKDNAAGAPAANKKQKRFYHESIVFPMYDFFVKNRSKVEQQVEQAGSPYIIQDRMFRIKGLKAAPGGKPNPARVNVNSMVPNAPLPPRVNTSAGGDSKLKGANGGDGEKNTPSGSQGTDSQSNSGSSTLADTRDGALHTLLAVAFGYVLVTLL